MRTPLYATFVTTMIGFSLKDSMWIDHYREADFESLH